MTNPKGKSVSELYPYYGANGQVGWIDDFLFDEPLILLAEDGGFFGSPDKPIAYAVNGKCWVNNHAHVLRPKEGVAFDYCLFALAIRPDIGKLVTGNTRPKLNQAIAATISVPFPPLPEQKRIAAILNEQMAAVEKARAAAEAQREAAKALPAAYLKKAFPQQGQELPEGWKWVKLGEVCYQDRQIIEPSSDESIKRTYLSLEHIEAQTGKILREPSGQVEDEGKSTTFAFDSNHVLYGKLRPYLNKVSLPDFIGRCTTELIPLRPLANISRSFLALLLRRNETVVAAMRQKTGGRMPRANMDDLLNLNIPLPPLPEQKRIAAMLNEQMTEAEKLRKAIEDQLKEINAMPAALLRKAFNGEL